MSVKWSWCLVDESTNNLLTGWQKDGEKWYYLNANGTLYTGWLQYKNRWYYLLENSNPTAGEYKGEMLCNCTRVIGEKSYTFNSSGEWCESLVSDECIDFIKSFEGFSATKYQDEVGVWTLGYGMTGDEIKDIDTITEEQATSMLKDWINRKYAPVIKDDLDSKNISLKQNEFDSLVSMAYNVGTGGLLSSTLYKNIVAGVKDSDIITTNFQAWSNAGGKRLWGLYKRRTKEANMFLYGDYTGNN